MNAKLSWTIGGLFLVGCFILAFGWGDLATAQVQTPPAAVGRYQLSLKAIDSSNTVLFVFDSNTGRCWYRDTVGTASGGAGWTDLGSPLDKKKDDKR